MNACIRRDWHHVVGEVRRLREYIYTAIYIKNDIYLKEKGKDRMGDVDPTKSHG